MWNVICITNDSENENEYESIYGNTLQTYDDAYYYAENMLDTDMDICKIIMEHVADSKKCEYNDYVCMKCRNIPEQCTCVKSNQNGIPWNIVYSPFYIFDFNGENCRKMYDIDIMDDYCSVGTLYYDYVCDKCFNNLDECTCDAKGTFDKHLINIDRNVQKHIQILNEKGYKTRFSCEGHFDEQYDDSDCITVYYSDIYILFDNIYDFDIIPQSEFCIITKNIVTNAHTLDTKRVSKISYAFKESNTKDDFDIEKESALANLLEWCHNLPNIADK